MKKLFLLLVILCFSLNIKAQEQPSPILFIYDASGSMWGQLEGKAKKEIASDVLASTVGNLPDNQNLGLLIYGHRKKGDCDDIEYKLDLSNNSKTKVTNAIENINPVGRTPLARSATMAINSLKKNKDKATIILITDGIESCDGDICKVVTDAKASGIDFKLHIVGFGLKDGEKEQLKCAAQASEPQQVYLSRILDFKLLIQRNYKLHLQNAVRGTYWSIMDLINFWCYLHNKLPNII